MKRHLLFFLFFAGFLAADPAYIHFPSNIDYSTRESSHFRVLYRKGADRFAERTLQEAERAYKLLTNVLKEAPEKTWIVLADFQDSINGYALNLPWPHIVLFAVPPQGHSILSELDGWHRSLVLHEYAHTLHMWPAHGLWSAARAVFGSWVLPNALMPSHFHEGMATFLETQLTQGGRGKGTHFRAYRRMAVKKGLWNRDAFGRLDRMDGASSLYPQRGSAYFFGYFLHEELYKRKGFEGLNLLTQEYSSGLPYFLSAQLEDVYGLDYYDLWDKIFEKSTKEITAKIAEIEKAPLSKLEKLTDSGFEKFDVLTSPDGSKVAFRSSVPSEEFGVKIMNLDTKKVVDRVSITSSSLAGSCWGGPKGEFISLVLKKKEKGKNFSALGLYNVSSKSKKVDFKKRKNKEEPKHIFAYGCDSNLKEVVYYREFAGEGELVRMQNQLPSKEVATATLTEIERLRLEEGKWVTGIVLLPRTLVAIRSEMRTEIHEWKRGERSTTKLAEFQGNLYNLKPWKGKNGFLAIAGFEGRREVWAFDLSSKTATKQVAVLGGISSFDVAKNGFVVSAYDHGGYDVAKASRVSTKPISFSAFKPQESKVEPTPTTKISAPEDYSPLSTLAPTTWIPNLLFVPDGAQIGVWVPGFDLSQKHHYSLFGGYDTRGLPFANLSYYYRFGDRYSLIINPYFTPAYLQSFKEFYKRWGGAIGFSGYFDFIDTRWTLTPVFSRTESSPLWPAVQSVGARLSLSKAVWFKSRPLAVAPIRGTRFSLSHAQYFKGLGSDENFFTTIAGIDQYLAAPWWSDHVWHLRLRAGYTEGSVIQNSFFEGGGEILFYQARSTFLNRGFLPGRFFGRRMVTANLEYKFPIATVDGGYGLFPAFLKRIRGGLVADLLTFDRGQAQANDFVSPGRKILFDRYFGSFGLEIVSDWQFGFYLPAQVRMGFYHGVGPFGEDLYVTMGILSSL